MNIKNYLGQSKIQTNILLTAMIIMLLGIFLPHPLTHLVSLIGNLLALIAFKYTDVFDEYKKLKIILISLFSIISLGQLIQLILEFKNL